MPDVADYYKELAKEHSVKPNSQLVQQLTSKQLNDVTDINLDGNLVGPKGVVPVVIVARDCRKLQSLSLKGNHLESEVASVLLAHLSSHPKLQTIDLCDNDLCVGGPELVKLLKKNKRITALSVENTNLRPLFTKLITIQCSKNTERKAKKEKAQSSEEMGAEGSENAAVGKVQEGYSFGEPAAATAAPEGSNANEDDDVPFGTAVLNVQRRPTGGAERRHIVISEEINEHEIDSFVPPVYKKNNRRVEALLYLLERHNLFSHLEDYELRIVVDAMPKMKCEPGETLYKQGDEGDKMYIIISGDIDLVSEEQDGTTSTAEAGLGDTLAHLHLLYHSKHNATAKCRTAAEVYTLDRHTYKCILSKASKKKRAMYEGFLSGIGFLKGLAKAELLQLADALKSSSYSDGETLITYGETGENFFIIVEGVVEVFGRNENQDVIKVCEFTNGDCVGELEFINKHLCVADVKAKGFVRTAKMNRHHFEMVMGPVKEVLARTAQESTVYEYYRGQLAAIEKERGAK